MNSLKEEIMGQKNWAVVGVTEKKEKFGYKIWKILRDHNYTTFGVNPNYDEIEGEKIYHSLRDIGEKIDVIDMVIPPKHGEVTLREAKDLGVEYIFFQPGTYNKELVKLAEELGFKYLLDDCVYASLKAK